MKMSMQFSQSRSAPHLHRGIVGFALGASKAPLAVIPGLPECFRCMEKKRSFVDGLPLKLC